MSQMPALAYFYGLGSN